MKCGCIMLRIRWYYEQINQSILKRINADKRLSEEICGKICRFFGHIIQEGGLDQTSVSGRMDRYRRMARPTTRRKSVGAWDYY